MTLDHKCCVQKDAYLNYAAITYWLWGVSPLSSTSTASLYTRNPTAIKQRMSERQGILKG